MSRASSIPDPVIAAGTGVLSLLIGGGHNQAVRRRLDFAENETCPDEAAEG